MTYAISMVNVGSESHVVLNKFSDGNVSALAALTRLPRDPKETNVEKSLGFYLQLGVAKLDATDIGQILQMIEQRTPRAKVSIPTSTTYFLNLLHNYTCAGFSVPETLTFFLQSHDKSWNIVGLPSVVHFKSTTPNYAQTHGLFISYIPPINNSI